MFQLIHSQAQETLTFRHCLIVGGRVPALRLDGKPHRLKGKYVRQMYLQALFGAVDSEQPDSSSILHHNIFDEFGRITARAQEA